MKCESCEKVAMRLGTNGRGYCLDHLSEAYAQTKRQSERMSRAADFITEDAKLAFTRERHLRAI